MDAEETLFVMFEYKKNFISIESERFVKLIWFRGKFGHFGRFEMSEFYRFFMNKFEAKFCF